MWLIRMCWKAIPYFSGAQKQWKKYEANTAPAISPTIKPIEQISKSTSPFQIVAKSCIAMATAGFKQLLLKVNLTQYNPYILPAKKKVDMSKYLKYYPVIQLVSVMSKIKKMKIKDPKAQPMQSNTKVPKSTVCQQKKGLTSKNMQAMYFILLPMPEPRRAPSIWAIMQYFLLLFILKIDLATVTEGLRWPPEKGAATESAKQQKQLIRNSKLMLTLCWSMGCWYLPTHQPQVSMSTPINSKNMIEISSFLKKLGSPLIFLFILSCYLSDMYIIVIIIPYKQNNKLKCSDPKKQGFILPTLRIQIIELIFLSDSKRSLTSMYPKVARSQREVNLSLDRYLSLFQTVKYVVLGDGFSSVPILGTVGSQVASINSRLEVSPCRQFSCISLWGGQHACIRSNRRNICLSIRFRWDSVALILYFVQIE